MPNAYHLVLFTTRDDVSDDEVLKRFGIVRDLAVSKGYLGSADDLSVGKVVIPAGDGTDDLARARQMSGGFTWGLSVRFNGKEGLDRYLKESQADIHTANLMELFVQPLHIVNHDHVNQLA